MRIFSLIFTALFSISSSFALLPPKTLREYWNNSFLRYNHYKEAVLDHCYDSPKNFHACIESLSIYSQIINSKYEIKSLNNIADNDQIIKSFHSEIALILNPKSGKENDSILKNSNDLKRIILDHKNKTLDTTQKVTETYLKTLNQKIDFNTIYADLSNQILLIEKNSTNEPYYSSIAINSALKISDDPHTHINTIEEMNDLQSSSQEEFVGIGIQTQFLNDHIFIQNVIENFPAYQSGIHEGDEIIKVDHRNVSGIDDKKLTEWVRGPENSVVQITVKRNNKIIDFNITRKKITTDVVTIKKLYDLNEEIIYIKLENFMDTSAPNKIYLEAIKSINEKTKGIILDLQNNGGGRVDIATLLSSFFSGDKLVVTFKIFDDNGKIKTEVPQKGVLKTPLTKLPLVILLNSNSASASELLAGALQDHGRAWILGDRSFGKGTAQGPKNFLNFFDTEIVKYKTIARFHQPSGRSNQIYGIIPNFYVPTKPGEKMEDILSMREEDLYTNAIENENTPWKETREEEVQKISKCVESKKIDALYETLKSDNSQIKKPDYRKLIAEATLLCDEKVYE